ncbi:hypothetical protein [Jiella sonneratiae]|uniref:Uncharacterized protein n=1 Tax=Jiella sonneratiae TaxID=2816856 RepID=A0ABS3J4F5_9HYPH|nr:hypothetical protein [Jiella sonneratiae]MBO0904560.1 hypothetical protein [Jiella sonneratiae]
MGGLDGSTERQKVEIFDRPEDAPDLADRRVEDPTRPYQRAVVGGAGAIVKTMRRHGSRQRLACPRGHARCRFAGHSIGVLPDIRRSFPCRELGVGGNVVDALSQAFDK